MIKYSKYLLPTMRAILYMAITANGMIAKENDDTSWVSPTEWKNYSRAIKKSGNMIIGRRTYEVMLRNNEFKKLRDVTVVVLSRKALNSPTKKVMVASSPQEALNLLQQQKFKTALLCGGGKLNSGFMKEKLIDEIYLDVEPIILGRGIKLCADADFECKLDFFGIKKLSKQEAQLHYKVKK